MTYAVRMEEKLRAGLAPSQLEIVDESHRHAGHAGHDPRGETHFKLTVVSAAFVGKSRVERQRMVYALVAAELAERVHALSVQALAPDEAR